MCIYIFIFTCTVNSLRIVIEWHKVLVLWTNEVMSREGGGQRPCYINLGHWKDGGAVSRRWNIGGADSEMQLMSSVLFILSFIYW